jgi:RNA polymerase sigma factor (sigma-70 family)
MDESELVDHARAGDAGAIEELIARTWPLVWQWAYGVVGDRTLADHVAQEAVLRAFQSLDRFDPERPFRPWLKRITVNYAIDQLRRQPPHELAPLWMAESARRLPWSRRPSCWTPSWMPSDGCRHGSGSSWRSITGSITQRPKSPVCSNCRPAPSPRG